MKKLIIIIITSIFAFSCSDENSLNENSTYIKNFKDNSIIHNWELIITIVDNNGNPASEYLCVYRTDNNVLHGCGENQVGSWWAANVDEIQWPQTPEEIVPNLLYGVQYRISSPNMPDGGAVLIKYNYAGNPDTYLRYNKDKGQFFLESLGEGVQVSILR